MELNKTQISEETDQGGGLGKLKSGIPLLRDFFSVFPSGYFSNLITSAKGPHPVVVVDR